MSTKIVNINNARIASVQEASYKESSTVAILRQTEFLGKQLTVYGTPDNPLFLAKDVADWIEHSDVSTMMRNVDDEEKATNIVCTLGGNQKCWFLTEDGLYEVLMQSRKPIAKQFKKGVKSILRDIRRNGYYAAAPAPDKTIVNRNALSELINQMKVKDAQINKYLELIDKSLEQIDRLLTVMERTDTKTHRTPTQPSAPITGSRTVKHDAIAVQRRLLISGREIAVFGTSDCPYYLAQDIADLLGFVSSNNMIHSHIKESNRQRFRNPCRLRSTTWFIDEGGIYDLWDHYQYAEPYRTRLMDILAAIHKK